MYWSMPGIIFSWKTLRYFLKYTRDYSQLLEYTEQCGVEFTELCIVVDANEPNQSIVSCCL